MNVGTSQLSESAAPAVCIEATTRTTYSKLTQNRIMRPNKGYPLSIDEIIKDAIARERLMKEYYVHTYEEVGPDARELLSDFSIQHDERINKLKHLLTEIEELRELNASIAD